MKTYKVTMSWTRWPDLDETLEIEAENENEAMRVAFGCDVERKGFPDDVEVVA